MKNRAAWRRGFGLAQIMAILVVVLPTIAFIITFLIDYWAVMRIDNNLKLLTNMATSQFNNASDLSIDPSDIQLKTMLTSFCPKDASIDFVGSRAGDASTGVITVNASYTYNGT